MWAEKTGEEGVVIEFPAPPIETVFIDEYGMTAGYECTGKWRTEFYTTASIPTTNCRIIAESENERREAAFSPPNKMPKVYLVAKRVEEMGAALAYEPPVFASFSLRLAEEKVDELHSQTPFGVFEILETECAER